jgi:hypothetical protein
MQFNAYSTHTSGNGWLQHSIGTWSLFAENKLAIKNVNGLIDTLEAFNIILNKNTMTWNRKEEGENVKVFLERIDKIPTSDGNELLGLWKLNEVRLDDHMEEIKISKTLYIAWDNKYFLELESNKKEYGIYKVHGHKSELQMVNYGEHPKFKFYHFSISDKKLTLTNKHNKSILIYSRIYQFLQ